VILLGTLFGVLIWDISRATIRSDARDHEPAHCSPELICSVGLILWVVALVPPVLSWAGNYEFVQALQFSLFCSGYSLPACGRRPWRWLALTSDEPFQVDSDGKLVGPTRLRRFDVVARSMKAHKGHRRAVIFVLLFVADVILWRLSPVVDTLVHNSWLTIVESLLL